MTEATMRNAVAEGRDAAGSAACPDGIELASLVAARLCHDLVSPLGAIGNGVELLEMSGNHPGLSASPELALISESVGAARARLRFYRTAFGHAPADQRIGLAEITQLTHDFTAGSRLTVELDGQGDLSRPEARMLLLAIMCFESAMPWGGRVLVCRTARGWRIVGEASRMRIERDLWHWLDAEPPSSSPSPSAPARAMPAPAEVHFALLGVLSAAIARPVSWDLDATGAEISF